MSDERQRAIESVRERLQRRLSPRAHMMILVMLTAVCGFLSSFLLLRAGLHSMAIRYPLGMAIAYLFFLGLVALWLRRYRLRARVRDSGEDTLLELVLDVPFDELWSALPSSEPDVVGEISGEGGGVSWGDGHASLTTSVARSSARGASSDGVEHIGGALDLEEGALWLIPVAIIGTIALGVVVYVVYLAPMLFAELLIDAGLAAGLYRRVMREERRSWMTTAVRSTVLPACFVAALLALAGNIMQGVYPDAQSIGAVVAHLRTDPPAPAPR